MAKLTLTLVLFFFANLTFAQEVKDYEKDFKTFWGAFNEAVKKQDCHELGRMTHFPLNVSKGEESTTMSPMNFSAECTKLFHPLLVRHFKEQYIQYDLTHNDIKMNYRKDIYPVEDEIYREKFDLYEGTKIFAFMLTNNTDRMPELQLVFLKTKEGYKLFHYLTP